MVKDKEEVIKTREIVDELFKLLELDAKTEVYFDKDNEAVFVEIKSEKEAGLIIGSRGDTLNSLQSVIGMILMRKLDRWQRVIVNVADWREKQKERLEELAMNTSERVRESGEAQNLYNLSAYQRRIIHMSLKKEKGIETISHGEGKERYLEVHPKKTKK